MKITPENFSEEWDKSLARLLAAVDHEITERQKFGARGHHNAMKINRTFYEYQLKTGGTEIYLCSGCGSFATANYNEPNKTQMSVDTTCFHCNYWKQLSLKVDKTRLVIDGHIYGDGGNRPNAARKDWLGFGGDKFYIERDGVAWETNNLWSGSTVPQRYIESFPDNAKFLKGLP